MGRGLATAATLLVLAVAPATATAAPANPWLGQRVLNMAHQGGEDESPSNTMFAYRRSLAGGADMLELDVHTTKDGRVVVLHDANVDRTTNGQGSVYDTTLAELQALDAGYNFVPGRNAVRGLPPASYPYRGIRTGQKKSPAGYTPEDFRIPTLDEVLAAFPDVPLNVEIKGQSDSNNWSFLHNAEIVADLLRRSGRTDVIVVSFNQQAVDRFHQLAPAVPLAPGVAGNVFFVAGLSPGPGVVALQVPPVLSGITIVTPDYVRRAHASGYAVHVWFSGQEESERVYKSMLDMGVDGLMPAEPDQLEKLLCARGTPRPGANPNHCGRGRVEEQGCAVRATKAGRVTRTGRLRVDLVRPFAGYVPCAGKVALERKVGRKVRAIGRATFVLPAGQSSTTVRLRLSKYGRKLVAKTRRSVRVRGAVRVTGRQGVARTRLGLRRALRSSAAGG
jgi:glycerophosphoryl diester phosphodiesterase